MFGGFFKVSGELSASQERGGDLRGCARHVQSAQGDHARARSRHQRAPALSLVAQGRNASSSLLFVCLINVFSGDAALCCCAHPQQGGPDASSGEPSFRFFSFRIKRIFKAVTSCNSEMDTLVTDTNRSIATLAITTLLKTGSEVSNFSFSSLFCATHGFLDQGERRSSDEANFVVFGRNLGRVQAGGGRGAAGALPQVSAKTGDIILSFFLCSLLIASLSRPR